MEAEVPAAPAPPVPGAREEVEREIAQEDEQVLWPLTARLAEIADRLERGEGVEPAYIARGVALWNRYGSEIHARRVRRLLGLFPATTPKVDPTMPERRRFRRPRASEAKVAPERALAVEQYREVVHEQGIAAERMAELRTLVTLYDQGGYGMRERLASVLHSFVMSERAWARYEEEFAARALDPTLPVEVDRQVHRGLAEVTAARGKVEPELRAYLAEPIPARQPAAAPA